MRPRGWLAVGALALLASTLPAPSPVGAVTHNGLLTLTVPGPFRGCGYFGATTNEALRAVLDLVRPSAFQTNPDGSLAGEDGPITSAELVSLNPQTVTYTVQPGWTWSNGTSFTVGDLIAWDHEAVHDPSSLADGYRDIATLTASPTGTQLTAVFATPYSDWDTLFRDVNERGTAATCTLSSLAGQPSLGPYTLRSITPTRAVLSRNLAWMGAPADFDTLVIDTQTPGVPAAEASVVDYAYGPPPLEVSALTGDPSLSGTTAMSDQLVVVGFSPANALTRQLDVRQFLALSIDRQHVINDVAGPISYSPGLADSVLYTQADTAYPGTVGLGPYGQGLTVPTTTFPTTTDADCVPCAAPTLRSAGFFTRDGLWWTRSRKVVAVTVAVGPTPTDVATARVVIGEWRTDGIVIRRVNVHSNLAVAQDVRAGRADAGIFTITTGATTGQTARSWTGSTDPNTFDLGWRSTLVNQYYLVAQDTFNPIDAESSFASIDQVIAAEQWERPLFTEPSVLMWSTDLSNVVVTTSLTGLVDEAPSWGVVPGNDAPQL